MASWGLPALPYHPAKPGDGFWEPVTSTINWCEEDYYATIYIAEIVNTLTNIAFVLLALKGAASCLRHGHDRTFLATFAGYAAVGTGSVLFHSSLKYPMQLVDELSMIYTTCFSCYASFAHRRPPYFKALVAITLVGLSVFITVYYHYIRDPTFHQVAYALLTATVLFRGFFVMERALRPRWRPAAAKPARETRETQRRDDRDRAILARMWLMISTGLAIFLGGFAIWQLDNIHCGTVRRWRRELGLPWGIVLEGHGWWHLMTGVGAYFYITWGIWLRHCVEGRADEYDLYWPSLFFSLPEVVRKDSAKGKTMANGELKKTR